jgi:hypothetical protein
LILRATSCFDDEGTDVTLKAAWAVGRKGACEKGAEAPW